MKLDGDSSSHTLRVKIRVGILLTVCPVRAARGWYAKCHGTSRDSEKAGAGPSRADPKTDLLCAAWAIADVRRSVVIGINPGVHVAASEMHSQKTPRFARVGRRRPPVVTTGQVEMLSDHVSLLSWLPPALPKLVRRGILVADRSSTKGSSRLTLPEVSGKVQEYWALARYDLKPKVI